MRSQPAAANAQGLRGPRRLIVDVGRDYRAGFNVVVAQHGRDRDEGRPHDVESGRNPCPGAVRRVLEARGGCGLQQGNGVLQPAGEVVEIWHRRRGGSVEDETIWGSVLGHKLEHHPAQEGDARVRWQRRVHRDGIHRAVGV